MHKPSPSRNGLSRQNWLLQAMRYDRMSLQGDPDYFAPWWPLGYGLGCSTSNHYVVRSCQIVTVNLMETRSTSQPFEPFCSQSLTQNHGHSYPSKTVSPPTERFKKFCKNVNIIRNNTQGIIIIRQYSPPIISNNKYTYQQIPVVYWYIGLVFRSSRKVKSGN